MVIKDNCDLRMQRQNSGIRYSGRMPKNFVKNYIVWRREVDKLHQLAIKKY